MNCPHCGKSLLWAGVKQKKYTLSLLGVSTRGVCTKCGAKVSYRSYSPYICFALLLLFAFHRVGVLNIFNFLGIAREAGTQADAFLLIACLVTALAVVFFLRPKVTHDTGA